MSVVGLGITAMHKEECLCIKQIFSDLRAYSNEEEVEYSIFCLVSRHKYVYMSFLHTFSLYP